MITIGQIVSRLRGAINEYNDDSNFSNRRLWNTFYTFANQMIKQDADNGKLYNSPEIWKPICVEMEPVSSLYCDCVHLPYDCTVYRSRYKLPNIISGSNGPIYRWLSTIDLGRHFTMVTPYEYSQKSKIRYNKTRYAFIHNGYLYTPDHTYGFLSFSAMFDGDISEFLCDTTGIEIDTDNLCTTKFNEVVQIPTYIQDACIKAALSELLPSTQIPSDEVTNVNNIRTNVQ